MIEFDSVQIPHIAGSSFSWSNTIKLPVGEWTGTAAVVDTRSSPYGGTGFSGAISVALARVNTSDYWVVVLSATADQTALWPQPMLYNNERVPLALAVKFADNSVPPIEIETQQITVVVSKTMMP